MRKSPRLSLPLAALLTTLGAAFAPAPVAGAADYKGNEFFSLSYPRQVIEGVPCPRTGLTLYRGTVDAQMNLEKAIRAMAGDSTANIESFFYSSIVNQLQGRPPGRAVELSAHLDRAIRERSGFGKPGDCEAHQITQQLAAYTFKHLHQTGSIVSRLLDYSSGSYSDWPDNIVFTTFVSPVAGTYGPNVIVIREQTPRSVDMNCFNKVKNGTWHNYTRDIGEFSAPSFIPGGDVVGFQLRTGTDKSWHQIGASFYKVEAEGKTFILALDGAGRSCIDRKADGTFVYCNYRAGSIALAPPPLTPERVPAFGVVQMCGVDDTDCDRLPASIKQMLSGGSGRSLDSRLVQRIQAVTVGGKKARYFPAP